MGNKVHYREYEVGKRLELKVKNHKWNCKLEWISLHH